MLAGRQQEIHAERDRKLDAARKQRQVRRQQAAAPCAESAILTAGMDWQALTPITKQ